MPVSAVPFTNTDLLTRIIPAWLSCHMPIKWEIELRTYLKTSTATPLKFGKIFIFFPDFIIDVSYSSMGSHQIRKIAGCAFTRNVRNVCPATVGLRSRHASWHVRDARVVMSVVGKMFPAFLAHAQPAILLIWWGAHDGIKFSPCTKRGPWWPLYWPTMYRCLGHLLKFPPSCRGFHFQNGTDILCKICSMYLYDYLIQTYMRSTLYNLLKEFNDWAHV